ncbi:hypothetical protein [Azospirillum largimobile]
MPVLAIDDFGERIQALRPAAAHTVLIGAATQSSQPFGVVVLRLVATSPCFVAFGAAPSADVLTGHYLPQGVPEYFRAAAGDRIAVVRAAEDGLLHISEMG